MRRHRIALEFQEGAPQMNFKAVSLVLILLLLIVSTFGAYLKSDWEQLFTYVSLIIALVLVGWQSKLIDEALGSLKDVGVQLDHDHRCLMAAFDLKQHAVVMAGLVSNYTLPGTAMRVTQAKVLDAAQKFHETFMKEPASDQTVQRTPESAQDPR